MLRGVVSLWGRRGWGGGGGVAAVGGGRVDIIGWEVAGVGVDLGRKTDTLICFLAAGSLGLMWVCALRL